MRFALLITRRVSSVTTGLALGLACLSAHVAHASGPILEVADYTFVFPDPSGRNGQPDPAVWATEAVGTVPVQAAPGLVPDILSEVVKESHQVHSR